MEPARPSPGTLRIVTADDLRALRNEARTRKRGRTTSIKLQLPRMKAQKQRRAERRLNKAYFACGCAEATTLGLAALAGALVWLLQRDGGIAAASWASWLALPAAFIAGTGIGKWFGLVRARFALRREIDDLIVASGVRLDMARGAKRAKAKCAIH